MRELDDDYSLCFPFFICLFLTMIILSAFHFWLWFVFFFFCIY